MTFKANLRIGNLKAIYFFVQNHPDFLEKMMAIIAQFKHVHLEIARMCVNVCNSRSTTLRRHVKK